MKYPTKMSLPPGAPRGSELLSICERRGAAKEGETMVIGESKAGEWTVIPLRNGRISVTVSEGGKWPTETDIARAAGVARVVFVDRGDSDNEQIYRGI